MGPLLLFFIVLLMPVWIQAQFRLTPQPPDSAKVFLLADFGYTYRISNTDVWPYGGQRKHMLNSEIGAMVNIGRTTALGGNVHIAWDMDDDMLAMAKIRLRRWVSRKSSLDLALGYDMAGGFDFKHGSYVASIDYHPVEWFALTAQIEDRQTIEGQRFPVYGGVKFSSAPGLYLNGASLLGTATIVTLFLLRGPS